VNRIVAAAIAVLAAGGYLVLHDPNGGLDQYVHHGTPTFNMLLDSSRVHRAKPEAGELLRLVAKRGPVRAEATVRPLHLPDYDGDVNGLLPVYAEQHARELATTIPGFEQTFDGKTPVHTAPGYRIGFNYGSDGTGADILLVPPEAPEARDGVVVSLRIERPSGRLHARQRKALKAMRVAFRSFEFGAGRL
jgi:hypothetical protein